MSYILKTRDVGRDKHGISIHEYMCPDCGDVKIKTAGDAKKAKKCKKCSYLEKRTHSMREIKDIEHWNGTVSENKVIAFSHNI